MLTHRNALETARTFVKAEDVRPDDDWLAYLPMAWVGDAFYTLVLSLYVGFTCNCPESPETVQRDLRELGPTTCWRPPGSGRTCSPRSRSGPATRPGSSGGCSSASGRWPSASRSFAPMVSRCRWPLRLAYALGEFFVYGPVRDQLGLRRARWAYTGGAPLGPDAFRFLRAFGVNLKQVYGSTEVSALVSIQPDTEANPTTVGRPCPGIEVRIADKGEVLIRSAGVFRGYFKADEATREVIDAEGWFHTGRRRLPGPARASRHHRSGQGRGRARRRHPLRPPVHREQAQVQPLRPGGGGLRQRPAVRGRHGGHRPEHRRQLGGAPRPRRTPRTPI